MSENERYNKILDMIPKGTTWTIWQIKDFVQNNMTFTQEDLKPYTDKRHTRYQKWENSLQKALYTRKTRKTNPITHDLASHCYSF